MVHFMPLPLQKASLQRALVFKHELSRCHCCGLVAKSYLILCDPMDCSLPGSCVYGIFLGNNTGVGSHFLLQGIFPTQRLNQHLLHWQIDSLLLSYRGSLVGTIKVCNSSHADEHSNFRTCHMVKNDSQGWCSEDKIISPVKRVREEEQETWDTIRNSGDTKAKEIKHLRWEDKREIKICCFLERSFPRMYWTFKLRTWNKQQQQNCK